MKTKTRDIPHITAYNTAEYIKTELEHSPLIDHVHIAGSLRRGKPLVSDIDLVIVTTRTREAKQHVADLPIWDEIRDTPHQVNGIQVDLCFSHPDHVGAALLFFTGPKELNIRMRVKAKRKGWKLSRYGLSDGGMPPRVVSGSEAAIFDELGMGFVEPEDRR